MLLFSPRLMLMISILYQSFFTAGQEVCSYIIDAKECIIYHPHEFYQTPLEEVVRVVRLSEWRTKSISGSDYLGITHIPSQDFNIYLSIHSSNEFRIQMSFDLSLNYKGIMNLRSRVLLRKKRSD